jgi:hypothetical protein
VSIKAAMPAGLDEQLDNPTPFTQRGQYVEKATPKQLTASVIFADKQSHYLRLQVEGGTYTPRDQGIRLPGNIQLNAFGNIPRGLVAKLKAGAQNGTLSAAIVKRLGLAGGRRKGAAPVELFYGQPRGGRWKDAPVGIWRRVPGSAGGPGKLVPVIVFEDTPAHFDKRLDLRKIAMPVVQREFAAKFKVAMDAAVAEACSR